MSYVSSHDGVELAVLLRALEWDLDTLAHALPTGRVHADRVHGMASTLRSVAERLDEAAGIMPGEIENEGT